MAIKVKAKNTSRALSRLIGLIIALALIVFVIIMTAISSAENRKTITVVRIKPDASLSANSMITEDVIEAYDMYYKEFENYGTATFSDGVTRSTLVTWENRDLVVGQRFSAYYQRGGTVLFWDSTITEQSRKNSYLYNMTGELLNIKMTTTGEFGDMVVPGDTLNIRATWEEEEFDLPTEEAYMLSGGELGEEDSAKKEHNELLFSEVTILDMLNGSGSSVFDIYYDYIAMSKDQQAACLADESFLQSVQPASILLEVTAEEVERFTTLQTKGATYQMTLLPRTTSSAITETLSEIQTALSGLDNIGSEE